MVEHAKEAHIIIVAIDVHVAHFVIVAIVTTAEGEGIAIVLAHVVAIGTLPNGNPFGGHLFVPLCLRQIEVDVSRLLDVLTTEVPSQVA